MTDAAQPAIGGVTWPYASASRFVSCDGLRWHVQRLGSGPQLVLVHGTGASTHSWEGLVAALEADFTLVLVDLPGHGFTQALPRAEMTLASLSRRLASVIASLGLSPVGIVGHSAGAAIAIRAALDGRLPSLRMIVSVNGALLPWGGVARWLFPPLARVLSAGHLASHLLAARAARPGTVSRMLAGTGALPPPRSVRFYELLLEQCGHVQAALDMMAMWDLETLARELPRLRVPLELIACGADLAVPADAAFTVRDVVPDARVHFIRALGHLAHEERPDEIARIIREAWRRVSEKGAGAHAVASTGGKP